MIAQGVWWSGYLLFPFVLAKSLGAPGWLVTLSVVMETTFMLLAVFWGQLMDRGGRRRWLVLGGVGGRLSLLLAVFTATAGQFLVLIGLAYFFAALVYPAQNGILQANISPERRGRVFGLGAMVQHFTAAATSLLVGYLLDLDPGLYRLVFPAIGAVGFLYLLILARLPRPEGDTAHDPAGIFVVPRLPLGRPRFRRLGRALVTPYREAVATFRADRAFFWFESNFMIYGIAYMMLIPVLPLFFTQELNLSYKEISSARVLIASVGVASLGPLMGRLMDRIHPVRLCTMSFGIITLYPAALAVGAALMPDRPALVAYLAFGFYSLGMAGINVTWNVGSISFAPPGQGGYYQGIHVAMVGIRGLLGPVLGFALTTWAGYREVFIVAAGVFIAASLSSAALGRTIAPAKAVCDPPR
ncbi:MFS transporter [bacterium]|nr:MFS transporter [bacterium]